MKFSQIIKRFFSALLLLSIVTLLSYILLPDAERTVREIVYSYTVKSKAQGLLEEEISYTDKIKPQIELQELSIPIDSTSTKLDLFSSKRLKGDNLLGGKAVEETAGKGRARFFEYNIKVEGLDYGYNARTLKFSDKSGNINEQAVCIFNQSISNGQNYVIAPFQTSEVIDVSKAVNDTEGLLAPVSKKYQLTAEYEPAGLRSVSHAGVPSNFGTYLRPDALNALEIMYKDMKKAGLDIYVTSAYRSYEAQAYTYLHYINLYDGSFEKADRESARPGYSEHQLGTTMDLVNSETSYRLNKNLDQTKAGKWLKGNAYKYGFVLSYPKNSENITGYMFEPWHWRYIGKDNAEKFKNSGLTLNEYLTNIYKEQI